MSILKSSTTLITLIFSISAFSFNSHSDINTNDPNVENKSVQKLKTQNPSAKDGVSHKVIYGEDNRKDLFEIQNQKMFYLAQSTLALVESSKVKYKDEFTVEISTRKFGDAYGLCEEEPFREQPTTAFCSGFFIGKDLVVTAGHCIRNLQSCKNTKFVFDFALYSSNDYPNILKAENIYNCSQLIHSEVNGLGADFAIVKLDREVLDRAPLTLRASGQVAINEKITVIGHPSGLPTKVADGAKVRAHVNKYFVTNLDTYGGNSGSAVFNDNTGDVEGILVRGATDYVYRNGCRASNICTEDGCRGEDVTNISEVLKHIPNFYLSSY